MQSTKETQGDMARLLALEDGDPAVRGGLMGTLRVSDEAVILPCSARSKESGAFKNVVMRLSGSDKELPGEIFSPNWFCGVSLVSVPSDIAEAVLNNPTKRASALKNMSTKIASELHDTDLSVGPPIQADSDDRDTEKWIAGFDSGNSCVGLYSALQNCAPENGLSGFNRAHRRYYLVCKTGGGVAAQTFHSRLITSLQAGKTLDQALEGGTEPGPQGLRRVATAGKRNRARILAIAADAIGFFTLDTLGDNASIDGSLQRIAIPDVDVSYNTIRKDESAPRSCWQYCAGCVDGILAHGMLTSSNLQDGFVLFSTTNDDLRLNIRNEAYNSVPFVTKRIITSRDITTKTSNAMKTRNPHPDYEWTKEHFSWKNKDLPGSEGVIPPSLWGSHESEAFLANWARELSLSTLKTTKLSPELVCVGGCEPSKLRAILRTVNGGL
mgnify:CR=1 FL=1|tara:strand:+ start:152 stop:1471 length:1320 start_codon:yes stop_codon:yes gene_type:complete